MKVELIDYMGNDDRVVESARVSFDKIASNYTTEQNNKLIKYLAKHGHFTPFTHPQITLRETVPIFIARQRMKSTVGFTYNEVSRRYVDDAPEFYVPDVWRKRAENVKQGSSDEEIKEVWFKGDVESWRGEINDFYCNHLNSSLALYNSMIDSGVAPEQARMVLPQSMYTSYYVTGSLSAFARAYNLRSDVNAQKEAQVLAQEWANIIEPLFPESWKALTND